MFINVQTVSHCILLILDTIKTCRIYHANEQLQSQIVRENEVTRRNHVIRRSVSTFLGSTNCLLIIRCLSKLSVCMTYVITFLHEYATLIFPPYQQCCLQMQMNITMKLHPFSYSLLYRKECRALRPIRTKKDVLAGIQFCI